MKTSCLALLQPLKCWAPGLLLHARLRRLHLEFGSSMLIASLGVAEESGEGACSWAGIPRRAAMGAPQKPCSVCPSGASSSVRPSAGPP